MSDYAVEPINDGLNEFNVEFHGPKESNVLSFFSLYAPIICDILSTVLKTFLCED